MIITNVERRISLINLSEMKLRRTKKDMIGILQYSESAKRFVLTKTIYDFGDWVALRVMTLDDARRFWDWFNDKYEEYPELSIVKSKLQSFLEESFSEFDETSQKLTNVVVVGRFEDGKFRQLDITPETEYILVKTIYEYEKNIKPLNEVHGIEIKQSNNPTKHTQP